MDDAKILNIIGRNIASARRHARMTQECLAELVGIHWQTISNIERGKHPFAVTTFAKVAQNLHASADMLLLGIPPVDQAKYKKITKALARRRAVSGK